MAQDVIKATVYPWQGPKDQKNKAGYLHFALCNFIALRGHKIFVASPVDPFFVDFTIFHQYPSTYSTDKFHDIHSIHGCLWRFYVCRL